jgi:hypothetical protein
MRYDIPLSHDVRGSFDNHPCISYTFLKGNFMHKTANTVAVHYIPELKYHWHITVMNDNLLPTMNTGPEPGSSRPWLPSTQA